MSLLDKDDKEIHKFYVDLGRLSFFGKELRNVSIYHYPIIIFEFMTGYYTTEELFAKNTELALEYANDFIIVENINNFTKTLKPSQTVIFSKKLEPKNNIQTKNLEKDSNENKITEPDTASYDPRSEEYKSKLGSKIKINDSISTISQNDLKLQNYNSENLSKSLIQPGLNSNKKMPNMKRSETKYNVGETKSTIQSIPYVQYYQCYVMLDYLINPQENTKTTNPNFNKELEIFNEGLEKYKRKIRILEIQKEIEFLTKKNEEINKLNKDLEDAIKHKSDNLKKVKEQLEPNMANYNKKQNQLVANLKGRGQFQLIYDSFVYQKMAEICFVFFNNKIPSLYDIPEFYSEQINIDPQKKQERLDFYNQHKKSVSAMMGHICQLLIYLSKIFNIPLRFPIFLNGSKSYIMRSTKEKSFLPLYYDPKKEDKHGNFENALNCLKDDIKEIFNFLSLFPEIVSKQDYESVNNMNGNYLFFFFFVIFNHSLFRFMKELQNSV